MWSVAVSVLLLAVSYSFKHSDKMDEMWAALCHRVIYKPAS